jgi:hypothetical protein
VCSAAVERARSGIMSPTHHPDIIVCETAPAAARGAAAGLKSGRGCRAEGEAEMRPRCGRDAVASSERERRTVTYGPAEVRRDTAEMADAAAEAEMRPRCGPERRGRILHKERRTVTFGPVEVQRDTAEMADAAEAEIRPRSAEMRPRSGRILREEEEDRYLRLRSGRTTARYRRDGRCSKDSAALKAAEMRPRPRCGKEPRRGDALSELPVSSRRERWSRIY